MIKEPPAELESALATVAAALADPSRIKILCALMDGRSWTATELSITAEISASTASAHLTKLVTGKLITCLPQGRHRYYHLAGQDVAELLEKMMALTGMPVTAVTRKSSTPDNLRLARTCYDHLAGETALTQLGLSLTPATKRVFCCGCLDWSERRFHLGGYLGAAFFTHCEQKGWLTRTPGYREVTITEKGKIQFRRIFDI